MGELDVKKLRDSIKSKCFTDKQFFLDILNDDKQKYLEEDRIKSVMLLLKVFYINRYKIKIMHAKEEIEEIKKSDDYSAQSYKRVNELYSEIRQYRASMDTYKCFFEEPYFARMDLVDEKEGYNSYYIGKKGDLNLEIVDWRAPLAKRYYQKSRISFSINEYNYKVILRRALRTKYGKLIDFKNEYLNLKDYLSKEEMTIHAEDSVFDPFLKEILRTRKEQDDITDIIETIQEKQYEIITKPERDNFILSGCAGSGKTMVMLHRLSYLMYNNESLKPKNVLVLTPSNSFNAFIDELATILELEKVHTITINDYFIELLKNAGIDVNATLVADAEEDPAYLKQIYSSEFKEDLSKKLFKIYDGLYGLFKESKDTGMLEDIIKDFDIQVSHYERIKNTSVRVRRAVLGEMKEREGKLCYTRAFRDLLNCVLDCREFLKCVGLEKMENYDYFYKRLFKFYKDAYFMVHNYEKILQHAVEDLEGLKESVLKEMAELKRHKTYQNGVQVETYPERIQARVNMLTEIDKTLKRIEQIGESFIGFIEFNEILLGNVNYKDIGKCNSPIDVCRFFYKDLIKSIKRKYKMTIKGLYKSDAYVLCLLLCMLGHNLEPRYSLVFIDEGQDISFNEYQLLRKINENASFNIFGDLAQNITTHRGLTSWEGVIDGEVYTLNQNYRNTNQIVDYVAGICGVEMYPIGFDGDEVKRIPARNINGFFKDGKGLKAVIVSDCDLEKFNRKSYNVLRRSGKISKKRINIMTVYESKGLEFTSVAVADKNMTANEKYIACTRALKELVLID